MLNPLHSLFDSGCMKSKIAVPEAINNQMMEYFRLFIAIGGMPKAVQSYVDTKDFREVDRIQKNLLRDY